MQMLVDTTSKLLNISIRKKAFIFVLALIVFVCIVLNFLYISQQKNYLFQSKNNFNDRFEYFYNDFLNNLKNNAFSISYEFSSNLDGLKNYEKLFKLKQLFLNLSSNEAYLKDIKLYLLDEKICLTKDKIILECNYDKNLNILLNFQNEPYYLISFKINSKYAINYTISAKKLLDNIKLQDEFLAALRYKNQYFYNESDWHNKLKLLMKKDGVINFDNKYYINNEIYLDNNFSILILKDITKDYLHHLKTSKKAFIISMILVFFAFICVYFVLGFLINKLLKTEEKLKKLNANLQNEIDLAVNTIKDKLEENRQKEQMLNHQSKLAALGQMLACIAHEYKQPLATLGAISSYLEISIEKNKIDDKFKNKLKEINPILSYMSKTIDDFYNFFKTKEEKSKFFIYEAINNSLTISNASLNKNAVCVILRLNKNIQINTYKNSLTHILINLLTNAKDALKTSKNPFIIINLYSYKNSFYISIKDNGEGIKDELKEEIFKPYFSTKDSSGLGLFMIKNILKKDLNATIFVKNRKIGAHFIIRIDNE
ncbi:sensor histidine kinase [Campylobacter canadensis]|uniref:histidine kinase n=1 Tax=Campylobacter canadensis TaxID=449520 RepID=A0ABS7WT40_9BACT|nr:HAMP domain-containing sensor histidine kinase [Campylobacter canadensis]MBZ7987945.1 HAMP domain-containing histidine kinase [Campylobacter canadensis]MBZ7996670.1 HAMP domain-containing histidine kinase [Campylobacter canadensis]MBZ7998528.1 HAMP domain-containing histidine kinase [Campylobacter canadensis]MBZ8000277.1 HAMP domain-containing histidine kinase [Campylobacter canadensis]MBZ8002300.1 HAMP domain-containing histidine kinase [Campylobacter canadensis]